MKYLTTARTSHDILETAAEVWRQYHAGQIPVVNGVRFENVHKPGKCQQNVRELVEATVYGEERTWPERGCCAGSTYRNLVRADRPQVTLKTIEPGDLVYMGGGGNCDICGKPVGHTGMLLRREGVKYILWQNTSADNLGLCERAMTHDQISRITGVFRLLPLVEEVSQIKVVWQPTNDPLIGVNARLEGAKVVGNVRELAEGLADLIARWQTATGQMLEGITVHGQHVATQGKVYLEPRG